MHENSLLLSDTRGILSDKKTERRKYGTNQLPIDKRLKEELEAEAKEKGVQPSVIVRQALEEHMRSRTPHPNCLDAAERLGLIGAAKGLPTVLSTNPHLMEGFGRG